MKDEQLATIRTALTLAARTFETYAIRHRAKEMIDPDAQTKAEANDALAAKMHEALAVCPGTESILLKWGTFKGWSFKSDNEPALALLREYEELGVALGCAQHNDTPRQKEIICELIDLVDGLITNDWSGEVLTRSAAKEYVMTYGKRDAKGAA